MPLQPQSLEIPLIAGIDTKTAEKAVNPPGLLTLKNARMDETGRIKKRLGYAGLSTANFPPAGDAPGRIEQVDVLGNRAVVWADTGLYERYESGNAYTQEVFDQKSAIASTELKQFASDVALTTAIDGAEDYAQTNGYELLIYMRAAGVGVVLFVEQSTGTVLWRVSLVPDLDIKAVAIGNTLMAVSTNGTDIRVTRWDTTTPTTSPAATTPYTDVSTLGVPLHFDVAAASAAVIVAYGSLVGAAPGISFGEINPDGTAGSSVQYPTSLLTGSGAPTQALGLAVDSSDDMVAAWGDGTRVEVAGVDSAFSLVADHVLDAAAPNVENVVVAIRTATNASVYYEEENASPDPEAFQTVTQGDVLITGAAGTGPSAPLWGFGLAHKPLVVTTGSKTNTYVGLVRQAELSGPGKTGSETVYLTVQTADTGELNADDIIAKYAYQTAAGFRLNGHVSQFWPNGLGGYGWALGTKYNVKIDSGGEQTFSVAMQRAYFQLQKTSSEVINGMLHRAGSVSLVYGGDRFGERPGDVGFVYAPVIQGLVPGTTGALTKLATYQYVAVYEYEDEFGNVHQSAPSAPSQITLSGSDDDVRVDVRTLVHAKASRGRCRIVIYRNEAGGTIFHRTSAVTSTGDSALSGGTSFLLDTDSDVDISTSQILYTTSGALPNYPPPPTDVLVEHKNRLWAIDKDTGNIWYSKEALTGEGIAFSLAFQIAADSPSDRPIGLVSMDTALVVFWRKRIGLIYGDGPNDAGVGGSFTTPQIIENSPVGCTNVHSIVKTPRGVMFKDEKIGIHLMQTGGGVPNYAGGPVEDFNANTIVDARLMDDNEEVRFTTDDGTILVYHYNLDQWSISEHQNLGGDTVTDANMWLGKHLIGTDSAALHHEQDALFTDGAIYVTTEIETGWIKFDRFQGGARVWDVFLLGEALADHNFNVAMAYDYVDVDATTYNVAAGTFGAVDPYQMRFHMARQTIQTLKLRIVDSQNGGDTEGYALANIRIHFGIEPQFKPRVGQSGYVTVQEPG